VKGALSLLLAVTMAAPATAGRAAMSGKDGGAAKGSGDHKLYWRLPQALPRQAGTGGFAGRGRPRAMPFDLAEVNGWLCVSSLCSLSGGHVSLWARNPEGRWSEAHSLVSCQRISRWARLNGRAFAVTGGRNGISLSVFMPAAAADRRWDSRNVPLGPSTEKAPLRSRFYAQVEALDLATHGKHLCIAAIIRSSRGGRFQEPGLAFWSSADEGRTWTEVKILAKSPSGATGGKCLALWSDGTRLHLVHRSKEKASGPLRHRTSNDGGRTWSPAPVLPVPARGRAIHSLRTVHGGPKACLLASDSKGGGRVYIYRSADGGLKWDKPLPAGSIKTSTAGANNSLPLDGWNLAMADGRMALGYGRASAGKEASRRLLHMHRGAGSSGWVFTGGLLLSSDGGRSWKAEKFNAGVKGRVYAPIPHFGADGGLTVLFGWFGDGGRSRMLCREARTGPPEDQEAAKKARIAKVIADLAAADYRVRERAAGEIRRMGMDILPALREAARDKDPERSLTAEDLLRKMTPDWWKGP